MCEKTKLSPAGGEIISETRSMVKAYEQRFGEVPDWVNEDLPLSRRLDLLACANRLRMRLADHDMVLGENL